MRLVTRGLADIDKALNEATFIVRSCWPEIIKLGTHLRIRHDLTLPQVSTLLELQNCPAIYDESN
jgi:hypothetical protein